MPRRPILSDFEKGQITTLHQEGFSIIEIVERLKRGRNVIQKYLSSPDTYKTKKSPARPSKWTKRNKRRMILATSKGEQSSKQIKDSRHSDLDKKSSKNSYFDPTS